MQRNLSAAIDLSQALPLVLNYIQRKWFSPTPRQTIELSAPQPFEYADYYSNYLTVATVGLVFGTLQPIILPITAFYLGIDVWFKKYLLQYVFITKTESGGRFWKLLVNRLLFAVILANAVIALVVGAQGIGSINSVGNGNMLYAMVPLPILMLAFKWYCVRAFDIRLQYYATEPFSDLDAEGTDGTGMGKTKKRTDKVSVRFGHPALFKPLLTPMVSAKSTHLLREVYGTKGKADAGSGNAHDIFAAPRRRSTDRAMPQTPGAYAYSDVFMAAMDPENVGKEENKDVPVTNPEGDMPAVEVVNEKDLDFAKFKKRAEFREEFGGEGELYGRPEDLVSRPGTPSTMRTMTEGIGNGAGGFYPARVHGSGESSRTRSGEFEGKTANGSPRSRKSSRLSLADAKPRWPRYADGQEEHYATDDEHLPDSPGIRAHSHKDWAGFDGEVEHYDSIEGTEYEAGYQPTPRTDRFESVDIDIDIDIPATPLEVDDILAAGNGNSNRASRVHTGSTGHQLLLDRLVDDDEGVEGYFGTGLNGEEDTGYDPAMYRKR